MTQPTLAELEALLEQSQQQFLATGDRAAAIAEYETAIAGLRQLVNQYPEQIAAWRRYAMTLRAVDRYDDSLAAYDEALSHHPHDPELWHRRGELLRENLKRYEEAITSYDRYLALRYAVPTQREQHLYPPDYERDDRISLALVWETRGATLAALGQLEGALDSYLQAATLSSPSPRIDELRRSISLKQAAETLANDPDNWQAWYQQGLAQFQGRNYEAALTSYDRALSLHTELGELWKRRGDVLWRLDRDEAALADYDRAITLNPDNPEFWAARGFLLQKKLKRYEAAIESCERAIALANTDLPDTTQRQEMLMQAWRSKAAALEALGQAEAAVEAWEQGRHPFQANFLRQKMARDRLAQAIAANPNDWQAWYAQGKELAAQTDYRAAIASYNRALELQPDLPTVASETWQSIWLDRGIALAQNRQFDAALL